jgi:hypothetical protein
MARISVFYNPRHRKNRLDSTLPRELHWPRDKRAKLAMKLPGFLLLLSGWGLVLAAVALLRAPAPRTAFVLAGMGVEALGLALVVRSHMPPRRKRG